MAGHAELWPESAALGVLRVENKCDTCQTLIATGIFHQAARQ